MRHWLPLLSVLLLASACGGSNGDPLGDAGVPADGGGGTDAGARHDAGAPPAERCRDGSPVVPYSLTRIDPLPPRAAIDLPNLHPSAIITSAGSGESTSLRFDICEGERGPVLHGVLYREDSFTVARRYLVDPTLSSPREDEFVETPLGFISLTRLPPDAVRVEGLAEALSGDLRPLRIRLMANTGLVMAGHQSFIAVGLGRVTETTVEYGSLQVTVGGLAPGDVYAAMRCRFNEELLETRFRLGTARFEVNGCSFLGGGFTLAYRIHDIAVTDSSPELREEHRGRFALETEAELEAALAYRWNHHNACDSFHLALPHADYAASSAPAAGCGPVVPHAPERGGGEPDLGPVRYRIRYYGGAWTDAEVQACHHYLWCND